MCPAPPIAPKPQGASEPGSPIRAATALAPSAAGLHRHTSSLAGSVAGSLGGGQLRGGSDDGAAYGGQGRVGRVRGRSGAGCVPDPGAAWQGFAS